MIWEIHPAKAKFAVFAVDWDRLNQNYFGGHPYFDTRFVGPLLEFFSSGNERLCILRTDGVISGALILQPNGFGRWSLFRPSQAQISPVLLEDARCLEMLFKNLPGIATEILLTGIDPRFSPDLSWLSLPLLISGHSRTIGIKLESEFQHYWGGRPKKLISNIARYSRRAESEIGPLCLLKFKDVAAMDAAVERYGILETAGWKGVAGTSISIENPQGAFYRKVLRGFASSGHATLFELYLADQHAASRFSISSNEIVVSLKTAYDESLARFAPGRILLNRFVEDQFSFEAGKTIEFYTNATRDQIDWATFDAPIHCIHIFRNDFLAMTFSILKVFQQWLRGSGNRADLAGEVPRVSNLEGFSSAEYDLSEFSPKENFEVSLDWFDLLQKQIYPDDQGVRYYFSAEESRPRTILPLRLTTKGRVRTIESLCNFYTSLYTPLLTKRSELLDLKPMLASATRDHGGAHVMRFSPMDPESIAFKGLINELRAIGWIPFRFFCFGNWYLKVEFDWEGYLKKRSANLRSTIKRMTKKFAAEGGVLEVITKPDEVERAIAAYQEVYSASWKIPEPYPEFVPSLIRQLSSVGMLRLGIARLQEKPVAAQLWIVGQDKACIYKVAYDEAYATYSPGTVLTSCLLQHVIENDKVKEVDFLIGDDKYKQIWMSDRRERWGVIAYNPRTFIGFVLCLKEAIGRFAKPIAKNVKNRLLAVKLHLSAPKKNSA